MTSLCFTTTAMPRPEVFEKTLTSFNSCLLNCNFDDSRLIINVDPFIDNPSDEKRKMCLEMARNTFGEVVVRMPDQPNFSNAMKWLWETAEEEIIFNLEDDWELIQKINLESVLNQMLQKKIDHVILRAWKWKDYPFCLSPGLLTKRLYKFCTNSLRPDTNPEETCRKALGLFEYRSIVFPKENEKVVLKDLGRRWIRKSGYIRGGGQFVKWERETEENKIAHDRLADQNLELE